MIDRLTEAALRDLASQIDWPPAVDLASRLRLGARPGRTGAPRSSGPPSAWPYLSRHSSFPVFLAWEASDRLPEVGESGTGLLIAEFRASLDEDFFQKIVLEGTTVDRVMVNGVPGFWLAGGPHVFGFETGRSDMVADASRLTGNVLVWEAGGITYRLESILSLEASLAIAESLRP